MSHESSQPRLTREEIAQREIGHTDVSARTAWSLVAVFLLTIAGIPLTQLVYDLRADERQTRVPSSVQIFTELPAIAETWRSTDGTAAQKVLATNQQLIRNLRNYEQQLTERSLLTRELLGPTRQFLAGYGGTGSESVEIGRDGWLFYSPDVDYLTNAGFLEPHTQMRLMRTDSHGEARTTDPRQAIVQFHQQLASRGIQLILMPTPGKASIYPEQLSRNFEANSNALKNSSFERFKQDLQSTGLLIFEPEETLFDAKHTQDRRPLYLRTDTHWTPVGMEIVAKALAEFIARETPLPKKPSTSYRQQPREITNLGDIAVMLRLPPTQKLFLPETVTIHEVTDQDGNEWQPDSHSDVLLLGDSFSNIYSSHEMGWGQSAGFAEHLSVQLQQPVDRISQNNGGALAVRQALFQDLARGNDRLAGKKLVIWQFATRDLTTGDWKLLSMPTSLHETVQPQSEAITAEQSIVQGTVQANAGAPRPGTVPYRDAITGIHLVDVKAIKGPAIEGDIVVYCWGLHDNQVMPTARYSPGQHVTLQLVPWENMQDRYGRLNRMEIDDPDFRLVDLPIFWGEPFDASKQSP